MAHIPIEADEIEALMHFFIKYAKKSFKSASLMPVVRPSGIREIGDASIFSMSACFTAVLLLAMSLMTMPLPSWASMRPVRIWPFLVFTM
jgi:hypothetical protein